MIGVIVGRSEQDAAQSLPRDVGEVSLQRFLLDRFLDVELILGTLESHLFQRPTVQGDEPILAGLVQLRPRRGIRGHGELDEVPLGLL